MSVARNQLHARLGGAAAILLALLLLAIPSAATASAAGPAAADAARATASKATASKARGARKANRRRAAARRRARLRRLARLRVARSTRLDDAVAVRSRAPVSSSSSSSGDLLFAGTHLSDFDQVQAAPGAIADVADPLGSGAASLQMTVEEGDVYPVTPTDNPRAQALSPSLIDPGEEIWLRTRFMLPSDFPSVDGWLSLVSIYGAPFDGSSPWQIGVRGDELLWQRNDSYDYDVPWRMPLIRGRWVEVLLHERFAGDGWVEMWIDGRQVTFPGGTQRLAMATMDHSNDGGPNHAKIMQYREAGMFDSATVYFGSLLLGRTREAVGA
jgi:hypothetical protein